MENQLKEELNPQEDISSKVKLVEEINKTSLPKVAGFSNLVQKVKNGESEIKKGNKDIPPVNPDKNKNNEKTNSIKDPLENVGNFIQGQVETGKEEIFPIDYDSYASYFDSNLGYYTPKSTEALNKQRSHEQGKVEEFTKAASRVALNVIPEVISQLSNTLDIEDYFNSDKEVGNWLSEAMKKLQDETNKNLPIYRENPDKPLDFGDSAYWFENGTNLVTSALGFIATGYLGGAVLNPIFTKTGQASKWLATLGKTNQLTNKEQMVTRGLTTVANAAVLNQAESVGLGVETFKQVYDQTIKDIKADKNNLSLSEEDIEKQARLKAAEAASRTVNFNKINILLNLTSANLFLKPPTLTREILKARSLKTTAKHMIREGVQEYAEENINDISQNRAVDKDYSFIKAMEYAFSEKGLESGLWGFIGGAGQTALTKAGKTLPIYRNKTYNNAFTNAYDKFSKNEELTEEEIISKSHAEALEKAGTDKNFVSANKEYDKKYIEQQSLLKEYDNLSKTDKINDFINTFTTAEDNINLIKQITNLQKEGNFKIADELQKRLVSNQILQSFEIGTTNNLIELYKGYQNLNHEDAKEKGIYKDNDENTENYYKTKAFNIINKINKLEKLYINSGKFINSTEVFLTESNKIDLLESLENIKEDVNKLFIQAQEEYKTNSTLNPSINNTFIDNNNSLGFDINKVTPAFKNTSYYEKIKKLSDSFKSLESQYKDLQGYYDKITTSTYQNTLASKINQYNALKRSELKNKKIKETIINSENETNNKIKDIKNSINEEDLNNNDEKNININNPEIINNKEDLIFPTFNVPIANNSFNNIKDVIKNKDINNFDKVSILKKQLNNIENGKNEFISSFPLDKESLLKSIDILKTEINKIKEEKESIDIKNNIVADKQQDLIDDLLTDIEENSSPINTPDFSKNKKRLEKLENILITLSEQGIDITDFKQVIKSFEENTNKQEVLQVFDKLKYLYNLLNNTNLEGSYESLILNKEDKNSIINHVDTISKFIVEDDVYYSDLDNISKNILEQLADLAKLNNIDTQNTGLSFQTYNKTASNKLAYLAKKYNIVFKEKISKTGKKYIEVRKQDIDNLLNETLDHRVLSPNFIKVGDTITFVPLSKITLEDGTIRTRESGIDIAPIGITINGELIEGLYLHDVSWLNTTNLDLNTKKELEDEQNELRKLREKILNSNIPISTKISHKTPGVPILNNSEEVNTVKDTMPDVKVGIIRNGIVYTNRNIVEKVINNIPLHEGSTAIIIPYGDGQLALPVQRFKLSDTIIESIIKTTSLFLEGNSNNITKEIDNLYGINILDSKGLEQYINQFIALSRYSIKDINDFNSILNNLGDNVNLVQFSNGNIFYGSGQGIEVNYISKSKNKGEERQKDLEHFRKHLTQLFNHINLDLLNNNKDIVILQDNNYNVVKYDDFVKENLKNPYLAIKLDNGETVYTIQGKIHFDLNIQNNNIQNQQINTTTTDEVNSLLGNQANVQLYNNFKNILNDFKNKFPEFANIIANNPELEAYIVGGVTDSNRNKEERGDLDVVFLHQKEVDNWTIDKFGEAIQKLQYFIIDNGNNRQQPAIESLLRPNDKSNPINIAQVIRDIFNNNIENSIQNETILLPNGKTFSFDDVTEDDLSPINYNDESIQYNLKSVEILSTVKAFQIFEKGKKNNWSLDKILKELQIPKEQKQLILDNGKIELNDIITDLLTNYSYIIEVNTTKTTVFVDDMIRYVEIDGKYYKQSPYDEDIEITKEEYDLKKIGTDSSYYSNLTVPGGTNYTEQEISTPLIIPSIKGHAQFSTDNGIGWFRSDDRSKSIYEEGQFIEIGDEKISSGNGWKHTDEPTDTKTRRILEVQSDLFQKGRDKNNLVESKDTGDIPTREEFKDLGFEFSNGRTYEEYLKFRNSKSNLNENQFLQLLNKDNNWVTFFIKSIIQDSAKKGYEKVLFPSGNTASKVEGHSTLEEFKKQKEDRIKHLEKDTSYRIEGLLEDGQEYEATYSTKEEANKMLEFFKLKDGKLTPNNQSKTVLNEINQLKQELERVETEGFGALKPIYNFYENTVTNILNKTYGKDNIKVITDEYGNTWNELSLSEKDLISISLSPNTLEDILLENSSLIKGISIQTQTSLIRSISYDILVDYIENKNKSDYELNIGKQLKVAFDSLDFIKDSAINNNHPKKDLIIQQIDLIKENKARLSKQIALEIKKKINLNSIINQEESNISEVELNGIEDLEEKEAWNENISYKINPITTLSTEVKEFLEGVRERIKDKNNNYKIRTNLLGLNIYIPSDVVFNDLLSILGKSNTNIIENINSTDNIPSYVKNIINLLKNELDNKPYLQDVIDKLEKAELHIQNGFITALNKTHTNHIYLQATYDNKSKSYSISKNKASYRNITNLILSEWQSGFHLSNIIKNNKINQNVLLDFDNKYKELINKNSYNYNDINNWLSILGISLPEKAFNTLNKYGLKQNEQLFNIKQLLILPNGIFKNIYDRVNKFNVDNNEITLENNNIFEDSSFKSLAYYISIFKNNLFNDNFKNGNGDTIYGWSNSRYITDRLLKLKSDISLLNELKSDIFAQHSTWLNDLLINNNGEYIINKNSLVYQYLEYSTSDSLKIRKDKLGVTIDNLNATELEKYHLGLFYNRGVEVGKGNTAIPIINVVYPTLSDKANTFVIQVPGTKYKLTEEGKLREFDINKIVKNLVLPEIERIKIHNKNSNKINIIEWQKAGNKFLIFPSLNNIQSLFESNGELKSDVGISQIHWETIKNEIKRYINNELQLKLNTWKEIGIVKTENGFDYMNFIDKNYKNNNSDNAIEVALNYVLNTMIANMNIQQLFIGDPVLYFKSKSSDVIQQAIDTSDNMGKRLAGDNAAGNTIIADKNESFNLLIIKDNIIKSTLSNYSEKLLGRKAKDYLEITSTDAQEYTSLEEHLDIMVRKGELSKKNKDRILTIYNNTGKVKIKDLNIILQPMKPRYVNNINRNGINSRLYIKSSSFPLIKEFTENTPLDKLRQLIENNNIHRVAHESAVKVGLPNNVINIYNENDIIIPDNWKNSLLLNIPREGHGIQQEVPYSENKKEINDGTQQAKLLFTNLLDLDFTNPFTEEKITGRELEQLYKNIYNKLFKNKYNKLIEQLGFDKNSNTIKNVKKLQRILIEEGLERNYNSNDIAALELNDNETKFVTDIWLNNSDSKINSLLNSIVDNKIRKRKFRGKSFVLSSKNSTSISTLKGANIDIIKDKDWNGNLQFQIDDKGNITYAEVLIPFKFWDNNGNILKVEDFTDENGNIDNIKLPKELLEIYGYRIPTSGINLISSIKIVGFLPSSYGDMIFAPDEFIVQMGSDFDIDKLYTHMYYTLYNESTNTLELLNKKHIEDFNKLKTNINTLKQTRVSLLKKNDKSEQDILSIKKLQERIELLSNIELNKINDLENAVLQNQLIDIHKTVLNSNNIEVQKARMKPLSFGNLPELAKTINKIKDNRYFSFLFNSYQQYKYINARAGKVAVGIFSLDMVFNSALQSVQDKLYFSRLDKNGESEKITYNIAGIKSNNLNDIKTSKSDKYKSDVLEGFMTAALDNEKEQLLGKLNINNYTFDFIRASVLLGYDEDTIVTLINQPIIFNHIKQIEDKKETVVIKYDDNYKKLIETLNIEDLQKNINLSNIDNNTQQAILALFNELSNKGKILKEIQSAINSDSSGVGKNIFYSLMKSNQIIKLLTRPLDYGIANINKLIGEVENKPTFETEEQEKEYIKNKKNEGYYVYNNMLIKPNSIGGFAGIYATLFNTELWGSFYPYTDSNFNNIISSILKYNISLKDSIDSKAKQLQNSITSLKSLLISNNYNLFSNYNNIQEARKDLLFDTETHMSLGTIIYDLKNNNKYTNLLLDRLQIGRSNITVDKEGKIPTDINYYNATTLEMDEEVLLNTFVDMIVNNKSLGVYNNEVLTTKILADKLITHQLITGGLQKSNQFIKYIPYSYLKYKGYFENLSNLSKSLKEEINTKTISDIYRTQYIQHNPNQYIDDSIKDSDYFIENGVLKVINDNIILDNIGNNKDIIVLETDNKSKIFKFDVSINQYREIDKLGFNNINEYDFNSEFAGKSNIYINKNEYDSIENNNIIKLPSDTETSNFLRLDRDTTKDKSPKVYNNVNFSLPDAYYLKDNNLSIEEKYKLILNKIKNESNDVILSYFAEELSKVTSYLSDVPLYLDLRLKAEGKTFTLKNTYSPVQIKINTNNINSEDKLQRVLIEEITHSLLKKELANNASIFTKNINNIRNYVKTILINKYGQDKFDLVEEKLKNNLPLERDVERNLIYNTINNDEFVAAAINNPSFQKLLTETEAPHTNKNIWNRIISYIKQVLVKLGIKENSNLESVLHDVLSIFKDLNNNLRSELTIPKYIRTTDYLNKRFKLTDENNSPISKGNAKEIVDFINKNIVNVTAVVNNNNTVVLKSNILKDIDTLLSPYDFVSSEDRVNLSNNLVNYFSSLDIRINTIKTNIKKAKDVEDSNRVEELEELLEKEESKYNQISQITNVLALSDKGFEDLQLVDTILNRPMNSEDILYVRHIINFWKNAKQHIFTERENSSENLAKLYGQIESLSEQKSNKLFTIEKRYIEDFIKKYNNKDINIDEIFENYKDINFLQSNFRDISTYDNILLTTIWKAVKTSNIQAQDESINYLNKIDNQIKNVLPILKSLNTKDIFEVFRQKTSRGKYTNHLVNPYNFVFYSESKRLLNKIDNDNNFANLIQYTNWLSKISEDVNLESIFPINNEITDEIKNNREVVKNKVGKGVYDFWFRKQQKKINSYNIRKDTYINKLMKDFNIENKENIKDNKDAIRLFNRWLIKNSPYEIDKFIFDRSSAINNKVDKYLGHKYYQPLINNSNYLDSNFQIINNNNTLLDFYNTVEDIFEDLNKYVPEHQQKTLAYNGIPSIEKSIFEQYSEKGLELGFKPIHDAWIKSIQTSFGDNNVSVIDPVTQKPVEKMNISIIKDYTKKIEDIVNVKIGQFVIDNNRQPKEHELNILKEDAKHEIFKDNSFDLGKILKVYSTLVLAHKHKAKIEDSVKIANNILHSYQEYYTRPDGTNLTNNFGTLLKKDANTSFIKTKESLDYFIGNIFYNKVKEEEGKQSESLTKTEKDTKKQIENLLKQLEAKKESDLIEEEEYNSTKTILENRLNNLGKTTILSKKGDNLLKYIQLKLMGWNVLGGISNMLFGYISNTIEASGEQLYNKKDLRDAYKLVFNSILKNNTFNKYETPVAKKIRNLMNKWDVMKDASYELYTKSIPNSTLEKLKWLSPYNINQRTEYINQAPLLIVLSKNTTVNINGKNVNIWEGYDDDGNWKSEYGKEPKEVIAKLRLKLDQTIKRNHGNYDNLSPLAAKKVFLGRATSQFRTWLYEAIAVRFEKERYDDVLEQNVKGRYISTKDAFIKSNFIEFISAIGLSTLKQWTFGLIGTNKLIENLEDKNQLSKTDIANLKKVATELSMTINVYLFLLILRSLFGDDDDEYVNTLINQGTRVKTDLLLYVNPNEFRNIARDIIPAFSIIKDGTNWMEAAGKAIIGEDEIQSGVHEGDSRLLNNTLKLVPFGSKIYSVYNNASQDFNK